MWKVIFKYPDGGKVKLTNSSRPMDKSIANKYYDTYGYNSDGGIFQQYPKKKYRPIAMATVVDILNAGGDLEKEISIDVDDQEVLD